VAAAVVGCGNALTRRQDAEATVRALLPTLSAIASGSENANTGGLTKAQLGDIVVVSSVDVSPAVADSLSAVPTAFLRCVAYDTALDYPPAELARIASLYPVPQGVRLPAAFNRIRVRAETDCLSTGVSAVQPYIKQYLDAGILLAKDPEPGLPACLRAQEAMNRPKFTPQAVRLFYLGEHFAFVTFLARTGYEQAVDCLTGPTLFKRTRNMVVSELSRGIAQASRHRVSPACFESQLRQEFTHAVARRFLSLPARIFSEYFARGETDAFERLTEAILRSRSLTLLDRALAPCLADLSHPESRV